MMQHEEEIRKACANTFRNYTGTEKTKEEVLNQIFGITEAAGIILGNSRQWYAIYEEYETKIEE